MNRNKAKKYNAAVHDLPKNAENSGQEQCDLTLDDLAHLGSNNWYQHKHIAGVAKSLCKKHGIDFEQQFEVAGSLERLEAFLKKSEPNVERKNSLFIIYSISNHWVTFCVTLSQNGVVVLYKDSKGGNIPKEISETIKKRFDKAVIKFHSTVEQNDGSNSGPMALRNMEIIMEMLKNAQLESVTESKKQLVAHRQKGPVAGSVAAFESKSFCFTEDVESVKELFQNIVGEDIVATCIELATVIAKDTEFKQEIKKLVALCLDSVDVLHDMEKYVKCLKFETDESERNPKYELKIDEILRQRNKITENRHVMEWSQQALVAIKDNQSNKRQSDGVNKEGFKSELEQKYPHQLTQFTKVFTLFGVDLSTKSLVRDKGVQKVSEILEIEYDKIKQFYETIKVEASPVKKIDDIVEPSDIDEITRQVSLLAIKQASDIDKNVKPIEQILAELTSGVVKDKEMSKLTDEEVQEYYEGVDADNAGAAAVVSELKINYDKVKGHYKDWTVKGVKEIKTWASSSKGHLKVEHMYEAVAIMDRANQLVTGHFLRDTQILAVLAFLGCNEGQGQLCQIETGEGKTVIVSLLAAIKVLQGKKVDVITSNGVLAEEGVNTRSNFFGVFGISVAHNNPDESYRSGPRKCYTADVVYGTMGSFQFDYLKDSFEGLRTRGSRKFEFVILDEVDSLLLDDGGHIAKLGEPFPGFDSLKYVYIKIWQALVKAEKDGVKECEDKLKRKAEELAKNPSSVIAEEEYVRYRAELFQKLEQELIAKIKKSDPANIDLIPVHLRQFARDMVDVWIKNAIYAKYSCHENEQYVIKKLGDDKESKIVPVDYQGTGVTLKTTVWSNGLHQFVQLKHNLHLTSETLTSSLISNIGYVKLYNNNIFGLTGTLGSMAEQQLLSAVYNVGYHKVPTFRSKVFEEISGKVVEDDQFKEVVVQDILIMVENKRSVLIICSTINEALTLEKNITKNKRDSSMKISTYFDENSSAIVQKEIGASEIVISTNIAGRGSDFKTSPELELNGGLHVLVCFLPVNQRVEDQAFGRTSRQGNRGTAQIVMKESEALGLGFTTGQGLPFSSIKERRNRYEAERLENIRKVELKEIDFYDRIFGLFSHLYRKMLKAEEEQHSMLYLLKDLKEFWAFWLHKKQKENDYRADVYEEFKKFKLEASAILDVETEQTFVGGRITHNPYYSIQQAEHFILNDLLENARDSLNHAINISGNNADLLYAAYIKLFEVELEQEQIIMGRFHRVLKRVVPIEFNLKKGGKDSYKKKAKHNLEKAQKALEKEINYIEKNFIGGPNIGQNRNVADNQDFVNILDSDPENILVRHISSRLTILRTFLEHIANLLQQITINITGSAGIALSSRVTDFWGSNNLTPTQIDLRLMMGGADGAEFRELFSVGLGTMFALREFPDDFDIEPFLPGLIQIGIGLAALGTGAIFLPSLPVMAKIAEVFICEGVADIVVYLLTGATKFDIKSKLISYGTQVITIGIFALLRYTRLGQKALNLCRRMITYLESSPNLRRLSEVLVPVLENVISGLQSQIAAARSAVSLSGAALKIGKSVAKKIGLVAFQHTAVTKTIDMILNPMLPVIKGYVSTTIHSKLNRTVLHSLTREEILLRASEILEEKSSVGLKQIASAIAVNVANSYDVYQSFNSHKEECILMVNNYTEAICVDLERNLQPMGEGDNIGNREEEVEGIIVALVDLVANHILGQLKKKTLKFAMKQIARQLKKI